MTDGWPMNELVKGTFDYLHMLICSGSCDLNARLCVVLVLRIFSSVIFLTRHLFCFCFLHYTFQREPPGLNNIIRVPSEQVFCFLSFRNITPLTLFEFFRSVRSVLPRITIQIRRRLLRLCVKLAAATATSAAAAAAAAAGALPSGNKCF